MKAFVNAVFSMMLCACAQPQARVETPDWARFQAPAPAVIEGYDGDAMEPFLSRDGALLFFNNRNDPAEQTDLHWAERIDDLHFRYRGAIAGANSAALDGVATMSGDGRICFVSTRSYSETLGTIYCGAWREGDVAAPALQTGVSGSAPGRLYFDVDIATGGERLIVADGLFSGGVAPDEADLRQARWRDGAFHLEPADDALFATINTEALEYAAALSADGRTLSFTRLEGRWPFVRTSIWLARRERDDALFGAPVRIAAITGFVEAATFTPDGNALYYHRKTGERFSLWRVSR